MFKNMNPQLKRAMMLGVCVLPIGGIIVIRAFDMAVSNVVIIALAVACPVTHLLMIRMGMHGHGQSHVHINEQEIQ